MTLDLIPVKEPRKRELDLVPVIEPITEQEDALFSGDIEIGEFPGWPLTGIVGNEEIAANSSAALYYNRNYGVPHPQAFDLVREFEMLHFGQEIPAATAWERIKQSYRNGKANTQANDLGYQIAVDSFTDPEAYEKNLDQLTKLWSGITPDYWEQNRSLLERFAAGGGEQIPHQLQAAKNAGKYGMVGAIIGGLAGFSVGGPAGGAAGFKLAGGAGAAFGAFDRMRKLETGGIMLSMMDVEDEFGNKMDPKLAAAASHIAGTFNGAVEIAEFATLLSAFGIGTKVFENAAAKVTSSLLAKGTFAEIAAKHVLKFGAIMATEQAQEFVQETSGVFAEELAKQINNDRAGTEFKPITGAELLAQYKEIAEKTFFAVGGLAGVGTSFTFMQQVLAPQTIVEPEVAPEKAVEKPAEAPVVEKPAEAAVSPEFEAEEAELDEIRARATKRRAERAAKPPAVAKPTVTPPAVKAAPAAAQKPTVPPQPTRQELTARKAELRQKILDAETEGRSFDLILKRPLKAQRFAIGELGAIERQLGKKKPPAAAQEAVEGKVDTRTYEDKIRDLPEGDTDAAMDIYTKHVDEAAGALISKIKDQPWVEDVYSVWGSTTSHYLTVEDTDGDQFVLRISDHDTVYSADGVVNAENSIADIVDVGLYLISKYYDKALSQLPAPKAEGKKAFEMTLLEFGKSKLSPEQAAHITKTQQVKSFYPQHRKEITAAIERGDTVPLRVLKEFKGEKFADEILDKGKLPGGRQAGGTILFDPDEWADMIRAADIYFKRGAQTLAELADKLVADFGEEIRQAIPELLEQVKGKKKTPNKKKPKKTPKSPIPKISKEQLTPPEVRKEIATKIKSEIPESDIATQDAVNVMEAYWKEFDERELEINVATIKNQEAIANALGKTQYLPESNPEVANTSRAMMLYIDLKEHPAGHNFVDKLSEQQTQLYNLSQDLPANIRKIADGIIRQNKKFGEMAVNEEVIANARENYIAHLWQKPVKQEALRARFRQTTARAKQRTIEGGIVEGLSRGKKLRVDDVTLATQIAQSQINQALVGKRLLTLGKDWGLLSHKQLEDWVQVEHPGFTTWKWAGKADQAKTYGRNFFVTEEGNLMERIPVYAEPKLGKVLNNVFTPSALYKIPGVKTVSRYNAQIKSTILFTSLYHHQAYMRSYAFGSRGLNPKKAYDLGRQAIMNMTPEVRLLVRNGLTIGRIQDYDPRMIEGEQTIWGRALSSTKPTEAIRKKLVALRKRQERFLFNKMGPALKMQAGLLELRAELKRNQAELEAGNITADEIAVAVANLINNDFGGLHLGRMGRSQTAQHLFRLLALAPDWTESNIRSAVDAFRGGETGYLHRMFWGRIAAKGLGATILFNLLLASFDDEDFVERYKKAWKTGRLRWLDVDITPIYKALGGDTDARKYFSLIGHFRDPVKFIAHPFISAKHKGSVLSRIMLDMMIGQDWAGREFTTIGELAGITEDGKRSGRLVKYERGGARPIDPSQIPSYALYQVRSAMPIPMQNLIAFMGGEMDAFDAITKSAGLMTATTYPKETTKLKGLSR